MKKGKEMPDRVIPAKVEKPVINNTELITRFRAEGGGVFHVRPTAARPRGMSVAYKDKGTRIEFATSVQHGADAFTKKIGTKVAIEHFDAGKTVTVPHSKNKKVMTAREALLAALRWF
jgi:hypothetical protein